MFCWCWLPLLGDFSRISSSVLDTPVPPDLAPLFLSLLGAHVFHLMTRLRSMLSNFWSFAPVFLWLGVSAPLCQQSPTHASRLLLYFSLLKGRESSKHSFCSRKALYICVCSALSCGHKFAQLPPCQAVCFCWAKTRAIFFLLPCCVSGEWLCEIPALSRRSSHVPPGAVIPPSSTLLQPLVIQSVLIVPVVSALPESL